MVPRVFFKFSQVLIVKMTLECFRPFLNRLKVRLSEVWRLPVWATQPSARECSEQVWQEGGHPMSCQWSLGETCWELHCNIGVLYGERWQLVSLESSQ